MSAADAARGSTSVARGVVLQLTRVEMRMLLRHPVMISAVVLSVLAMAGYIPPAISMSAAALLACHLCASRDVRHGTDEHVRSLPGPRRSQTLSHLLSIGTALSITAVLSVPYLWILATRSLEDVRPDELLTPAVAVALFFHGLSRVALLGALGVLLGRWIPTPLAGPVAVVVTLVLSSFPLSPLSLFPDEDIVTKTVAMLGLATASGVLALLVGSRRMLGATARV